MGDSLTSESGQSSTSIKSIVSLTSEDNSTNCEDNEMLLDSSTASEIAQLQRMFRLQVTDVYRTDECKNLMDYLRGYSSNLTNNQDYCDITYIADNDNCIMFFRSYIINVTENHEHMLVNISQRQYINFIKFVMALWNMSDKFDSLCARMATFDAHTYLIRLLGKINLSPKLLESKQIQLMVMSIVGILHNINNKLHYTRSRYRDEHLVNYLMPLAALHITKDLIGLKTSALLLLAFLVNENENSSLNANDDHIIYIITILKNTLDSPNQYSKTYGYHSLEILHSLRHIASPDNNKRSLVNSGVLPLIGILLLPVNEKEYLNELIAGLELLWSLSFSKECLRELNSDQYELKSRVEELARSDNKDIVLSARGILWNINAQRSISINDLIQKDAKTPNVNGHVMISYQHSTQEVMIRIKDSLVGNSYRVWMDVDHMRGSFVDAMAEGIQHASVLLIGMCQAFKNSPHCRQEVKYAYTLGIPLVPVMLEPGFAADGWLGLMCATLIHTEFIDAKKFDNNIIQLQRQLGILGRGLVRPFSNQDSLDGTLPTTNNGQCNLKCCHEGLVTLTESISNHQITNGITTDMPPDLQISVRSDHSSAMNQIPNRFLMSELSGENNPLFRSDSNCPRPREVIEEPVIECYMCTQNAQETPVPSQTHFQVLNWSLSQCMSWLSEHSIDTEQYGSPLIKLDGPLLFELAEMRLTAAESYFTAVKEELGLNFIDKLRLTRALRRLDELP